ncbi:MAG TPA: hypothetical protein VJY62_11945 [Bacteroidia bacterium]|nr:hypothetical protein [Bacteroidia bacterium]
MNIIKKIIAVAGCMALSAKIFAVNSNDSLGLAGDHLDLYAALDLFKRSESPEAFEKALNDKSNEINNLDLNNDGEVDYIKVIDKGEGDSHAFVLQDAVNENESQDVAVIEVEKSGNEEAHIQIVGDEDLYGKDYIIEPGDEKPADAVTPAPPPSPEVHTAVFVNVWPWRPVRYIYGPHYRPWISPWGWRHYPVYWKPWHPVAWRVYYGRAYRYHHPYYHRTVVYRINNAHKVYYAHRTTSASYQENRKSYNRTVNKSVNRSQPAAGKKHHGGKVKKVHRK